MTDSTQNIDKIQASSPEEANKALLYMLEDLNEMLSSVARGKKEWEDTVDSITDPLFMHDKGLRIVKCNKAYLELSGAVAFKDVMGRPYFEVFPKMEGPFRMCLKAVEEEEEEEISIAAINRIYKVKFYPLKNADGGLLYSVHIMEDVTEIKNAEEALTKTRNYLDNLLNYANAPIIVWDTSCKITLFNHAFERLTGYLADEVIGQGLHILFPKESREESLSTIDRTLKGEFWESVEIPIMRKDGNVQIALWNSANILADDGKTLIATIAQGQDITGRKNAEEKLQQELEVNSHLLMIAEATAETTDINLLLQKITGCSRKALFADACLIYLYDAEGGVFNPGHASELEKTQIPAFASTPLDRENPFVKKALDTKAPAVFDLRAVAHDASYGGPDKIPKYLKDASAGAFIPLYDRADALGMIAVLYKSPKTFSDADTRLMRGISHQVSVAIGQARLYREATEQTMELSRKIETIKVMHEIDREILSTIKSTEILDITARLVARLIQCDRATIVLVDAEKEAFIYAGGFGADFVPKGAAVPFKDTSAAEILKTGRAVYEGNLRGIKNLLPLEKKLVEEGFLSHIRVPISVKGEIAGLLTIGSKRPAAYSAQDLSTLENLASQIGVALENARLVEDLESLFIGTVKSLSAAIDAKSKWTAGHSERVCAYALKTGATLGLNPKELKELELASLLHDIGKIGTYEDILEKPGRLTDEEMAIVKQHPGKGAEILGPIKQLKAVIPSVKHHQECFDGSGYPDGIKGEDIPLYARIISVADTCDAMGADRPYRKGRPWGTIIEELKRCAGTQFDPEVVEAFLGSVK